MNPPSHHAETMLEADRKQTGSWRGIHCFLAAAAWLWLAADSALADDRDEFFEREIRPLLLARCIDCHGADRAENDLRLDQRTLILSGGNHGAAMVSGKPEQSLLIRAVRREIEPAMPPDQPLSQQEIKLLEDWIRDGAPWPASSVDHDSSRATLDPSAHWAYQPLSPGAIPTVDADEWMGSPIDRYVRAKHLATGGRSVGLADPATLLRRVSIDLIGLPPTPAQVRSFLSDPSPANYAAIVDQWLQSPEYGRRWGRLWLDVVRYADTTGCNSDIPIREAYLYRDYVIDALNADMPLDQFVQEQLAGDLMNEEEGVANPLRGFDRYVDRPPSDNVSHPGLLPEPTRVTASTSANDSVPLTETQRRRIIATGYLALSRRFGSEVSRYPVHLTIDDTIDNLGKAFLGLSISCARCHDHKFDALSQRDYYAIYGIFASTRYSWPGIELAPLPRDMVPLIPKADYALLRNHAEAKTRPAREEVFGLWDKWQSARDHYRANPDSHEADHGFWIATQTLYLKIKSEGKELLGAFEPHERAYGAVDADLVGDAAIFLNGDPERPGNIVPRGMPGILGGQTLTPEAAGSVSGRLQMARWLTDPENLGGQLLARVTANRIWQAHFGNGLVRTPNDFGVRGTPPTHPRLLDYLATRLIDSGWSMKQLHREIVLSRAYQLSSRGRIAGDSNSQPAHQQSADPDNRWLWRQSRRRMDAETLRDSLLQLSGKLDLATPGRPHPFPPEDEWKYSQHKPFRDDYQHSHRSVYLMHKRLKQSPYFTIFDGADTNATTPRRDQSVIAPQALFMLNNPLVHDTAAELAARISRETSSDAERIESTYLHLLGRQPTEAERPIVNASLGRLRSLLDDETEVWNAWTRALIRTNEFLYVD